MTTRFTISDLASLQQSGKIKGYQEANKARGGAVVGKEGKRSKYGNKKVVCNGIEFASKKEAARYLVLVMMERAGLISGLELQKEYVLKVDEKKICSYFSDFDYQQDGKLVVEDTKGFKTAIYRLKKKLMKAQYGIDILET